MYIDDTRRYLSDQSESLRKTRVGIKNYATVTAETEFMSVVNVWKTELPKEEIYRQTMKPFSLNSFFVRASY